MISRRAKPPTPNRRKRKVFAGLVLAGALWTLSARAGEEPAAETPHPPTPEPVEIGRPSAHAEEPISREQKGELTSYGHLAEQAAAACKWPLADHYLELIAELPVSNDEKRATFLTMADAFLAAKQTSRAVAILEKVAELFPHDEATAEIIFKLGVIYRDNGAPKLAISRFYSVLNSALKTDERGLEGAQELAKRAQWEIAQTYFTAQDFPQARKFYELFSRLDLSATELARVKFQLIHCRYLTGEMKVVEEQGRQFLQDFPDHVSVPECRYLLAGALRELKRPQDSLDEVLALLREEKERRDQAPEEWARWQKRAGNEFANRYYAQGDYLHAVTLYQALARLSEAPDWQWPVIYQMGLCFERLKLTARAAEAYKYILEDAKKPGREPDKQPEPVRDLPAMARWRGEQLAWRQDSTAQLSRIIGPLDSTPSPPPALTTSTSTAAPAIAAHE